MKAVPLNLTPSLVVSWLALWLAAPATADAAGWFARRRDDCAPGTRHARPEWAGELRNARRFESLNCAELAGYAESYRMMINLQTQSTFYRPVPEAAPRSGPPAGLPPWSPAAPSGSTFTRPEPR
jgi:hypothetical protein